jgi:hypothetical protein
MLKYIAIGGAAAFGVYFIAKKLAPATVTTGPIAQLADGFKSLSQAFNKPTRPGDTTPEALKGTIIDPGEWFSAKMPASAGAADIRPPTGALLGDSQVDAYAVRTADGDSAMADGLGIDRVTGSNPQPDYFTRYKDRATIGAQQARSPFSLRVASSKT